MSAAPRTPHPPWGLLVCSLEPWDSVWRRNQHLVSRLLADPGLRVVFVEPPVDPLHALHRGAVPRLGRGLRRLPYEEHEFPGADRLWLYEPTKWVPRKMADGGDRRRARAALRAARSIGAPPAVLWVNDISYAALLDVTSVPVVYDVTDDWLAAHRPPAETARLVEAEARLLREAAAVTVCSPALQRAKGRDRAVELVTNGVDVAAYRDPGPRPADLPAGPVALYVGTLHADRLDVALCVRTAAALAAVRGRLVLLGPDALEEDERRRLTTAGVVLLGARPFDTVPAYVTHADVLVVPHVVDAFTDSLDPLKLYEYRAAGRPVVATPVAGFRDTADPAVRALPATYFPAAVVAATRAEAPRREPPADLPTWEQQAALMAAVLGDAAGRPAPPSAPPSAQPRHAPTRS
ncbi:glycosyltransferase [Puerhibacterium puerhi]|uniref:glycosyltransferase n=1 Tax=Puerhibacterium puerhi TaxID=2692623 RepID=UPI001F256281|nr:glycosyltransferase [Puerhibacterium puerhi]